MLQRNGPSATAGDTTTPSSGMVEDVIGLTYELRELVHDQLQLAALETRLAMSRALTMVVIAVVMAVLLVSAWLALMGAALLTLVSMGVPPALAMLLLVPANLLLALLGWVMIQRKSRTLGWPATLRTLRALPNREGNAA